jgi:TRAP-type C4-dicarboxylate transport system permease small subunit
LIFEKFRRGVSILSKVLMGVSALLLSFMLLLGIADVAGRYLFNRPIIGALETIQLVMPGIILLCWPITQTEKAHIRVDVLISRFPAKAQSVIGVLVTCWSLVLFGLIAWQGADSAVSTYGTGRMITNINVPMYLPILFVPVGGVAVCLVFILDLVDEIRKLREA